jgi:hypothetical protein
MSAYRRANRLAGPGIPHRLARRQIRPTTAVQDRRGVPRHVADERRSNRPEAAITERQSQKCRVCLIGPILPASQWESSDGRVFAIEGAFHDTCLDA